MESILEVLCAEQLRVEEVLGYYKALWPNSSCGGIKIIENSLQDAGQAISEGDLEAMKTAYKNLHNIKTN